MQLSAEHRALLMVIRQAEDQGRSASTKEVHPAVLAARQAEAAGGPYVWMASAPWWGTKDLVAELTEDALITEVVEAAPFRRWDEPSSIVHQHFLALTEKGRLLTDGQ